MAARCKYYSLLALICGLALQYSCEKEEPEIESQLGTVSDYEGSQLTTSGNLWLDGYLISDPAFGTSGFIAQPGGGRRYDGTFGHLGDNANFWTATEYSNIRAWGRHIYSSYSSLHRYKNAKSDGFSVRCVKDN